MNQRFLAEAEKGMLWQPKVIESGREMAAGFDEEKEKRRASVLSSLSLSWFSVIHALMSCACTEFFGEVVYFTERGGYLELRVICKKLTVYRMACNDVRERCGVQDEENGPQHWALRHTILELWLWRGWVIYWSELTSVWEIWLKPFECSRLNIKKRIEAGEEDLMVNSVKSCRKV